MCIIAYFRRMRAFFILLVTQVCIAGCSNTPPAPSFTSADGIWTFKTPENAVSVDFELKTSAGILGIVNPASIVVGGQAGVAAAQMIGVALPAIGEIRINANDAGLVQPYSIKFTTCTVSADFKTIAAVDVEYTYPWGSVKALTNVYITRK